LKFDTAPSRALRLGTVYGVLLNDRAALEALGDAVNAAPYKGAPKAPVLYIKPRNTHAGDGDTVAVPAGVDALQTGPALGALIGRAASRVSAEHALSCIAGYTVVNDFSVPHDQFYRPSIRYRARDGFCPIAAEARPASAVADPDALSITVAIDGEVRLRGSTRGFVRPLARLIADVTEFMTLRPGDLLLSGVPHGAPLARAGQSVEVRIDGVGTLRNRLLREGA